jgi:hypothetical protein
MSRFTRRARLLTLGGLATIGLAAAAQLAVSPAAVSADTYTVPLHQDTPIQNSGYGEQGDCSGSPAQWGWHFVLPTNDSDFVTVTTTFETAGEIVTQIDPPSKHAYVYTATDDTLVSASAEVTGGEAEFFNLSHVCAGGTTETPSPTPSETVSETPSETPSETVSETPSETPSETVSETPSETPSETVSETPSETPSETVSETPSETPSETVSETPSETPSATVSATVIESTPPVSESPTESATVLPTVIESSTPAATVSATVEGVKSEQPSVIGTRLPRTGTPVPIALLLLMGFGLIAAGVVTMVAGETRTAGTGARHRR